MTATRRPTRCRDRPSTASTGAAAPTARADDRDRRRPHRRRPSADAARVGRRPAELAVAGSTSPGAPGDPALYVVEQAGRIVRSTRRAAARRHRARHRRRHRRPTASRACSASRSHRPATLAYVNYTDDNGDTAIAEYAVARRRHASTGDASARCCVIDQPYANHNGGDLAIGPDGMLYIGMGDGGSGGDPERRRSTSTTLLGKMLRIDPTPSRRPRLHDPGRQPVRRLGRRRCPRRDLVDRAAQPVAVHVRPGHRRPVDRRRRPERRPRRSTSRPPPTAATPAGASNFGWSAFEGNDRYNDDQSRPPATTPPVLRRTAQRRRLLDQRRGAVYRGAGRRRARRLVRVRRLLLGRGVGARPVSGEGNVDHGVARRGGCSPTGRGGQPRCVAAPDGTHLRARRLGVIASTPRRRRSAHRRGRTRPAAGRVGATSRRARRRPAST